VAGWFSDRMLQTPNPVRNRHLSTVARVAVAGLLLGVLTAYAQGWLNGDLNSLANSAAPWSLVAFALASPSRARWLAALCGALALALLEVGYVVGSALKGYSSAPSTVAFWLLAAAVVGPMLGLAGHAARSGPPVLAAVGSGFIAGVLVGEGLYGLSHLRVPGYSWGEIVGGLALLAVLTGRRPPSWWSAGAALAATAVVAGSVAAAMGSV
jgi:hypothetical protein